MAKASGPELTKYLDKSLSIKLINNRSVSGILRGYDQFMNIVLEDANDTTPIQLTGNKAVDAQRQIEKEENKIIGQCVIRGNSILMIEALDPIQVTLGKP